MSPLKDKLFAVIVPKEATGFKTYYLNGDQLNNSIKNTNAIYFLGFPLEMLLTVTKDEILGDPEILPDVYELLQKNDVWFANPIPPFKERMDEFREAQNKVVDKVVIIKKV